MGEEMSESNQTPQQPQSQTFNVRVPQVTTEDVRGFARAWEKGGIKILVDNITLEFTRDFANIVLKSFIVDQVNKQAQANMARQQQGKPAQQLLTPTPVPERKSNLIIEG